jgi:tRNA A37 threonylcarbamoyladenosine modification protein TsaB
LIQTYESNEQTSDALPALFDVVLKNYVPKRLFFARGPGSFMAIKISYIFLKTMSIGLQIPLLACDGFALNGSAPIRAMRNLYFIKENDTISTVRLDEPVTQPFTLPTLLDVSLFGEETEPLYMLPAV